MRVGSVCTCSAAAGCPAPKGSARTGAGNGLNGRALTLGTLSSCWSKQPNPRSYRFLSTFGKKAGPCPDSGGSLRLFGFFVTRRMPQKESARILFNQNKKMQYCQGRSGRCLREMHRRRWTQRPRLLRGWHVMFEDQTG